MGLRMCQLVATLCVASSLTLVALGNSDPLMGFAFEPCTFTDPTAIMGPILDMAWPYTHDV
jgi:hypothetical protein